MAVTTLSDSIAGGAAALDRTAHGEEIADPWFAATVTVPAARCGPPGTANGGWACGTVAGHLPGGPVEVTLRAPTPLDAPLEVRAADDRATLSSGGRVVAEAVRSSAPVRPVEPVPWAVAATAARGFPGHHDHPFPGCFVCGTERAEGDGLRLFPGPVADGSGRCAALFTPRSGHAGPDGRLSPASVWAALDCPTGWVNASPGAVALLGRLRGEVRGALWADRTYLVVAEPTGRDGRKAFGRASVYADGGHLLAASEAVWIAPRDHS